MQQHLSRYLESELTAINSFIDQEVAKLDALVAPAADHVLSAGGKRLRPLLTILFARAAGLRNENVYPLACSLEFLHSATLLHDDILDGAALRRGKAAAHLVFTRTETVLAGDVLLALANRLVADYGDPRLTAILSAAIMDTAVGEVDEIANLRLQDASQERYLRIIIGKTARLMEAACEAGALLAGAGADVAKKAAAYGLNLGIAFQMVDDALDYTAPSQVSGKPAGGDLREGKLTLPLLLFLQNADEAERKDLLGRLGKNGDDGPDVPAVLAAMQQQGCAEKVRTMAKEYADQAASALDGFADGPEKQVLSEVLDFVLTREK